MKENVNYCVIPAAGKGTRWIPLSSFVPKELLPLGNIPVIEHVVVEAIQSGCQDVIVIINPGKELLRTYLENRIDNVKSRLHFVYQEQPRGVADAICQAETLVGNNNFALIFPDMPMIYNNEAPLKQLIEAFKKLGKPAHILAIAHSPENSMILYEDFIIKKGTNGFYEIKSLVPKAPPGKTVEPVPGLHGAGRDIFTPEIFAIIKECLAQKPSGEVGDREMFNLIFERGSKVIGHVVEGFVCDTGTPKNYVFANIKYLELKDSGLP